jgi:hypothetical protein
VDEEGKGVKRARESVKIWQDVGCMNLRMKCVAVRTEGMNAARENISQ